MNSEATRYNVKGCIFYNEGNYDKAIECFKRALEIETDKTVRQNLGNAYHAKKDYDKAIDYFKRALEIEPNNASIQKSLGNAYYSKEDYDKAIECFEKAAILAPEQAEIFSDLGCAYYGKKNYAKAIDCLQKVLSMDPNSQVANMYLGIIYRATKNYDKALEYFEKSAEIEPEEPSYCDAIGNIYHVIKKDYDKAIEWYEKALNRQPQDAEILTNIGIAYCQKGDDGKEKGDYGKAIKFFLQSLEIKQDEKVKDYLAWATCNADVKDRPHDILIGHVIIVRLSDGLNKNNAERFVQIANKFISSVEIRKNEEKVDMTSQDSVLAAINKQTARLLGGFEKDEKTANGKSIDAILDLKIANGNKVFLRLKGPDTNAAFSELEKFLITDK